MLQNAVAIVLNFNTAEWKSLKALRKVKDAGEMAETVMADKNNNNNGTLDVTNGMIMIGGKIDEGRHRG